MAALTFAVGIMATTLLGERLTWRLFLGSSGIVAGLFIVIYALDKYDTSIKQSR